MSDIGEPIRKSEGLEKGDERLGRRTPPEGKPGGGYRGVPTGAMRGVPTGAILGEEEDEPPLKDGGEEVVSGIMSIMTIALIRSLMRSAMLSLCETGID